METVIVTRHKTFVEYLEEINLVPKDAEIIDHVEDENQVKGKHVVGILPFHLAAAAEYITVVPLNLSLRQRKMEKDTGEELPIEEIRKAAGQPRSYMVKEIKNSTTRFLQDTTFNTQS